MKPGAAVLCLLFCAACTSPLDRSLGSLLADAQNSWDHGDLPQALSLSARGIRLSQFSSDAVWAWKFRCIRAETLNNRKDFEGAWSVLNGQVPERIAKRETGVRVLIDRGVVKSWQRSFPEAHALFEAARKLIALPENAGLAGELAFREGGLSLLEGDEKGAQAHLQDAIDFAASHGKPILQATAITFRASILTNARRWDAAIDVLRPAAEMTQKLGIKTLFLVNRGNLGWCYYNLGDLDAALKYLQEADRVAESVGQIDSRRQLLTNIGLVYSDRDDFKTANSYHLRALELARQVKDPAAAAACLHNLAMTAFNREDLATAKKYSAEEIQLKKQSKGARASELYARYLEGHIQRMQGNPRGAEAIFQEIVADPAANLSLRWQSQVALARLHMAEKRMEQAQTDFAQAIQTFGAARGQLSRAEFRISFRSGLNLYYSDYIHFLMTQGKTLEALNVAEFSRAQVLSEGLNLTANTQLDRARLTATAAALHSVILSYWLTSEASYLWVITPETVVPLTLAKGTEIWNRVEAYRNGVFNSSSGGNTNLYDTLLKAAEPYLTPGGRVIVIPDGNLCQLNFETILVPGQPRPHYWIEDAQVSMATSLSLLRPHARAAGKDNILLIGDPVSPAPEFGNLPNAKAELHSIAERFPENRRAIFEGPVAQPSAYGNANPGGYSWIHFAAHAFSSRTENPLDAAIILSNEGDSYRLYARDIAKVPIHADLVTISACFGTGTRAYSGEGVVGLAWAFLLAGAHHVIASLWEVNDYYTAQLMDRMYERLRAGDDAAQALRAAKMRLLHSEYAGRNPRYWAAFQLYTGY